MGYWGVKSYENDETAEALDAAYEQVHRERYEQLMDDRNPMSFDEVQRTLSTPETLAAACAYLDEQFGTDRTSWGPNARLALAGVVVRHDEFQVDVPAPLLRLALEWLQDEELEWEGLQTKRSLRRSREIERLKQRVELTPEEDHP